MSGEAATQLDFAQAMTDFKIMFPDMEVGDMGQGSMMAIMSCVSLTEGHVTPPQSSVLINKKASTMSCS